MNPESQQALMKFDQVAGFARPIDLTGADVRFRMFRPRHTLDVNINIPSIDQEYVHKIELSDEQSQEYIELNSDAERQAFQDRLAAENRNEIEKGLAAFAELHLRDATDRGKSL